MSVPEKHLTSFLVEITNVSGKALSFPVIAISYTNACAKAEEEAHRHPEFSNNVSEISVYDDNKRREDIKKILKKQKQIQQLKTKIK